MLIFFKDVCLALCRSHIYTPDLFFLFVCHLFAHCHLFLLKTSISLSKSPSSLSNCCSPSLISKNCTTLLPEIQDELWCSGIIMKTASSFSFLHKFSSLANPSSICLPSINFVVIITSPCEAIIIWTLKTFLRSLYLINFIESLQKIYRIYKN